MKRTLTFLLFVYGGALLAAQPPASADQQPDFSPPPVPEFMLRKPAKPLTLEEMKQQADAAAQRAREERARHSQPASPGAKSTEAPPQAETGKK